MRVILNTRQMPLWTVFGNRHTQSFDRSPPALAVLFYDSESTHLQSTRGGGKKNRKACEAVTRFLNYRCTRLCSGLIRVNYGGAV